MPRTKAPKYRRQKHRGRADQAFVEFGVGGGKTRRVWLGEYDTPESRQAYDRTIGEWMANGRQLPPEPSSKFTIAMLVQAYWRWAMKTYPAGSSGLEHIRQAWLPLYKNYRDLPAADFTPKKLKLLRDLMVTEGRANRNTINARIKIIRRMFKWAVGEELVPADVWKALDAVESLRKGRSEARESEPVRPVAQELIDGARANVSRQVRALIDLQLLTGARPGELMELRQMDLDTSGPVWKVRLSEHKTAHHGHARTVRFGPKAQAILREFMTPSRPVHKPLFSPMEAEEERQAERHKKRKTPMSCGNTPGDGVAEEPERSPGDSYDVTSYRRAIRRGCLKAFPPPSHLSRKTVPCRGRKRKSSRWETPAEWRKRLGEEKWAELERWRDEHTWHPHQLRHNRATEIRRSFGLDGAQVILGHKSAKITEGYAEVDESKADAIISATG